MIDLARLARIVAMFDSPNVSERAAAFARADQIVRDAGVMWRDILPTLFGPQLSMTLSGVDGGHIDQCRDLLRNNRDLLNHWEKNFLIRIGGVMQLTVNQMTRLELLMDEVVRRRALQAEFGETAA